MSEPVTGTPAESRQRLSAGTLRARHAQTKRNRAAHARLAQYRRPEDPPEPLETFVERFQRLGDAAQQVSIAFREISDTDTRDVALLGELLVKLEAFAEVLHETSPQEWGRSLETHYDV